MSFTDREIQRCHRIETLPIPVQMRERYITQVHVESRGLKAEVAKSPEVKRVAILLGLCSELAKEKGWRIRT